MKVSRNMSTGGKYCQIILVKTICFFSGTCPSYPMNCVKMANHGGINASPSGMMSLPRATYSKETQNLLKELMQESKLTNFQQRQLTSAMRDGDSFPTRVHPTSSAKQKPAASPVSRPASKRVDPRENTPKLRSFDTIQQTGDLRRPHYTPSTGKKSFSEKDKERLQNMMAYGQDVPPPDPKRIVEKLVPDDKPPVDRFDELQQEINERRQFLQDMEALGQGDKYRAIIATEISQLIREMELIDMKRTTELNKLLTIDRKSKKSGIPTPNS